MKSLLIIDDEPAIRQLIAKYAAHYGFSVIEAQNGQDGLEKAYENSVDVVVVDIMMPVLNGYEFCQEFRKASDVPIIMLTAKDSEVDKILGFEMGIDDYIVKPFSPRELFYRIEAILKRGKKINHDIYSVSGFFVDFSSRRMVIDGVSVDLTPKEFDLLHYFLKNKNLALSRASIIERVWGYDFDGDERTLDTHIKRLRKKMGPYQTFIDTVRGVGYRYDDKI